MPPFIENITHNVDTGNYTAFIEQLRRTLAEHDDNPKQHVLDHRDRRIHHVLPKQRPRPRRWIYIKLVLCDGAETTLAVRDDNVYLIGFKNNRGELFEFGFSGTIDRSKKSIPMLTRSRFLECDLNYGSLLRGGARNFPGMTLGQMFARFAVRQLSGYSQGQGSIVDDSTRRALAGLMVMVCEATRMRPLLARAGWHARCCCIDSELVDYIWGWGDMSEALLRWKRDPDTFQFPECLQNIGVGGAGKALAIVELLLNTPIHLNPPRWRLDRWRQRPAAGDDDEDARRRSEQQRGRPSEKQQRPAAGEHGSGSGASGSGQQQSPPPNKRRRTEQQHDQQEQQQAPPPDDRGSGESQHSHQQETPPVSPADDCVARGRPLVEVFAVGAAFHFVGTIAVVDGMRGQVIYENNNGGAPPIIPIHGGGGSSSRSGGDDQGYAPLLLTGPYRAISAEGSFAIEVDISGAGAGAVQDQGGAEPSTGDLGELNWDCYDEEKVYDRPVTEIITTSSSGRKVEVTYAVLSDAVDAELQVHLRLPARGGATAEAEGRGAVIYGRIATRSKAFHDQDLAWSVLFDSEVEGVSLVTDEDGRLRLPLARSVVAMPLGSPLVIMATLYDAPPTQHGVNPVFQCQDMEVELPLDDDRKTPRRSADNGGGEFEVSITSPDCYHRPRRNDTTTPRRTSTDHYGCY